MAQSHRSDTFTARYQIDGAPIFEHKISEIYRATQKKPYLSLEAKQNNAEWRAR